MGTFSVSKINITQREAKKRKRKKEPRTYEIHRERIQTLKMFKRIEVKQLKVCQRKMKIRKAIKQ